VITLLTAAKIVYSYTQFMVETKSAMYRTTTTYRRAAISIL
jgi:hypothetical protein